MLSVTWVGCGVEAGCGVGRRRIAGLASTIAPHWAVSGSAARYECSAQPRAGSISPEAEAESCGAITFEPASVTARSQLAPSEGEQPPRGPCVFAKKIVEPVVSKYAIKKVSK